MSETDSEIVRHCLNGRPEAYRRLVRRHEGPLLAYLAGRLGDPGMAADVAQEAFVRAFFTLRKLRKPEAFRPWLVGIAVRVAKEFGRTERRQRQLALRSVDRSVECSERPGAGVRDAVSELPLAYREVVLLRYYGGLSCSEIGSALGLSVAAVTKRLSRAYALLRTALEEQRPWGDEVSR